MTGPILTAKDLTKQYRIRTTRFARPSIVHAAEGISLELHAGKVTAVVGESGSGKSTVLRALAGLNTVWTGRMVLANEVLAPRRDRDFFRRVQMVFQDPYGSLHPRQTVDRLLSEPLLVHGMGDIERRILRGLNEVALPSSMRFRYPHQLSGGQRQRVAIARALMSEPEVLLLDEPTSALDVSVQAEVLNLLSDLQQARDLTYILVSHNLAVVAHLCGRVGVMQGGELVELLSSDDLRAGRTRHPHTAALRELSIELEEPETI
jgi:peptide/nickel transport system ATP-binding protein